MMSSCLILHVWKAAPKTMNSTCCLSYRARCHMCRRPLGPESQTHLHSASASSCRGFLWSMMIMSWCLSRKHARTACASLVTVHLNPAFSHALQNPLHWLSSLVNTKSTWIKKARTLFKKEKKLLERSFLNTPQENPQGLDSKNTDANIICW